MKIAQETITRLYELTCLVATEYTQAELDKINQKLSDVVTKNGGEVKEVEDWGKKRWLIPSEKKVNSIVKLAIFILCLSLTPLR